MIEGTWRKRAEVLNVGIRDVIFFRKRNYSRKRLTEGLNA